MMNLASTKIIERAKAVFEGIYDLHLEDGIEDDKMGVEEYTVEEKDDDGEQIENDDEGALATKSDKDEPKTKKSSKKGVGKTVRKLISAAADPFGMGKTSYALNLNLGFQATNQQNPEARESGDQDGKPGSAVNDERSSVVPLSPGERQLRLLLKDHALLEKSANKIIDGCIRLNEKLGTLSKVEEQLATLQSDKDFLKAELLKLQKLHDESKQTVESQKITHRNEVMQLNSELKLAKEGLEKMKSTNEEQSNEIDRLKKALEMMTNQKEDLVKRFEQMETSLRLEVQQLDVCLQKAEKEKTEHAERIREIQDKMQKLEAQISASNSANMELQQTLRARESENATINSLLEASNAKIIELKRAIQILESDASTTTTVQAQGGGSFSCPICGAQFSSLASMQLHAEDCNG